MRDPKKTPGDLAKGLSAVARAVRWGGNVQRCMALLVVLTLASCEAGLPPGKTPSTASAAPLRVAVSQGQVVIAGPQGYCIDRSTAKDGPDGAFVLLGSCAAISGSPGGAVPKAPAVLTATIAPGNGRPVAGQLPDLNRYFRSATGLAALSRSGRPTSTTILAARGVGGVFLLDARDASPAPGRTQAEFWRAVLDLKGRIVTLNVTGMRASPLTAAAGRATLEAFVRQVQRENRGF